MGEGDSGTGAKWRWPEANRPSLIFLSCTLGGAAAGFRRQGTGGGKIGDPGTKPDFFLARGVALSSVTAAMGTASCAAGPFPIPIAIP